MEFKIAVLPGDGIGPEISVQGVDVMTAVCEKFGHKVSYEYALCGADAIDKVGDPFPEKTYEICKNADAVLFSAVGDPKFDNDPTAKVRPEQGLLAAQMNRLRAVCREAELAGIAAWQDGVLLRHEDCILALNRLSSYFYLLQLRAATGDGANRERNERT